MNQEEILIIKKRLARFAPKIQLRLLNGIFCAFEKFGEICTPEMNYEEALSFIHGLCAGGIDLETEKNLDEIIELAREYTEFFDLPAPGHILKAVSRKLRSIIAAKDSTISFSSLAHLDALDRIVAGNMKFFDAVPEDNPIAAVRCKLEKLIQIENEKKTINKINPLPELPVNGPDKTKDAGTSPETFNERQNFQIKPQSEWLGDRMIELSEAVTLLLQLDRQVREVRNGNRNKILEILDELRALVGGETLFVNPEIRINEEAIDRIIKSGFDHLEKEERRRKKRKSRTSPATLKGIFAPAVYSNEKD